MKKKTVRRILVVGALIATIALLSRGARAEETIEQQRLIDVEPSDKTRPTKSDGRGCICG